MSVKWLVVAFLKQEDRGSNHNPETDYHDRFSWVFSVPTSVGMVPQFRPLSFRSISKNAIFWVSHVDFEESYLLGWYQSTRSSTTKIIFIYKKRVSN
jgi:hypothetical protein